MLLRYKVTITLSILAVLAFIFACSLYFVTRAFADEPTTLTASWYSIASLKSEGTYAYSKGVMANGKTFKDEGLTCATRLWPLGTTLRITDVRSLRSVDVVVTDRIGKRFADKRIDLSKAAFKKIAALTDGVVAVQIERIR